MSFLPLISTHWSGKKICMLYFLVQSVGSLMVLRGGLISDDRSFLCKWPALGLLLKIRLAPLHFWGAALVPKLTNLTSFFFLTWQKIAPIFLFLISTPKIVVNTILILNIIVSSSCRIGSKNLYVLMFFSGLIHIRWMMRAPNTVACWYFMLYAASSGPIFFAKTTLNLPILILNLAGLPPMTGFIMKLITLQVIGLGVGFLILVFSSPILYAYIRVFLYNDIVGTYKLTTLVVCRLGWAV